ncbi:MAG: hypothetical protein ACYSTL_02705 [Planctomycetota bacterium]
MVEQYIEKIVLGVCVLLLVVAVFHWAISSPREVKLSGQRTAVPPTKLDKTLLEAAQQIKDNVQEVKPTPYVAPDFTVELKKLQDQPIASLGPQVELGLPCAPLEELEDTSENVKFTLSDLVPVIPKPNQPLATVEWELPKTTEESDDVLVAHVATTYPWGKLQEQWQEVLAETDIVDSESVVVGVEAEIREWRFGGTWGEPRTAKTTYLPMLSPGGEPLTSPVLPDYTGDNAEEILRAKRDLKENWQETILEPEYWEIWWPGLGNYGDWRIHLPATTVSKNYAEALKTPESDRGAAVRGSAPDRRVGFGNVRDFPDKGMGGSGDVFGMGGHRPIPSASRAPQARPGRPTKTIAPLEPTPVPPLPDQIQDGEVLFWLHDVSLASSKVYQYRVRLVLANPLLAYSGYVKEDVDAQQALLKTPFSDWSDRVAVPRATEFFVVGQIERKGLVKVEVFRRALGQWVSERFNVTEGSDIGQTEKKKLTDPGTGMSLSKEVDFSTGAVAVRFDFTKKLQKGKVRRSRPTVEMIYLDEGGLLKTRIGIADRESERYKQLRDETERAEAAGHAMSEIIRR